MSEASALIEVQTCKRQQSNLDAHDATTNKRQLWYSYRPYRYAVDLRKTTDSMNVRWTKWKLNYVDFHMEKKWYVYSKAYQMIDDKRLLLRKFLAWVIII